VCDYIQQGPHEITLKKQESIRVIQKNEHWLIVETTQGKQGWVPLPFISIQEVI
jgi:hypothetical protein